MLRYYTVLALFLLMMPFAMLSADGGLHPVYGHQQETFSIDGYDIVDAVEDPSFPIANGQNFLIDEVEKVDVGGGGYRYQIILLNPESGKSKSFLSRVINNGDWSTVAKVLSRKSYLTNGYRQEPDAGMSWFIYYLDIEYRIMLDDTSEQPLKYRFFVAEIPSYYREYDDYDEIQKEIKTRGDQINASNSNSVIEGDKLKFNKRHQKNGHHFTSTAFVHIEQYRGEERVFVGLTIDGMRRYDSFHHEANESYHTITKIIDTYPTVITFEKIPKVLVMTSPRNLESSSSISPFNDLYQSKQLILEWIKPIHLDLRYDYPSGLYEKVYKFKDPSNGTVGYFIESDEIANKKTK